LATNYKACKQAQDSITGQKKTNKEKKKKGELQVNQE